MQKKYHVKKNDKVIVISGKWKGEEGTVLAIYRKKDRAILELPNLSSRRREEIGRRTIRRSQANSKGGLVERAISVHVSNLKLKES